ncbi:MAG TPA: hypothetical protein VFN47_08965 [Pedococcus sp.]|nr:hypothetical protein [Pedococcus sp.]
MTSDYRLSPLLAARLLGVSLVLWGLLVFLATAIVVLFSAPVAILTVAVVLCVVGVFTTGWYLTRRTYVVRLTDDGYRVRFVRGAGVTQARWVDVEDAVTAVVADARCIVLRLRDGRSTTVPVDVLAGSADDFVRTVRDHLDGRARHQR